MDIFCFASSTFENIVRGVRAKMWAVEPSDDPRFTKSRAAKAIENLEVGDLGLFYCSEKGKRSFVMPFRVGSPVDPHRAVRHPWDTDYVLPFSIQPLGNLSHRVGWHRAKRLKWPKMYVLAVQAFVPRQVTPEEWEMMRKALSADTA